MDAGWDAGPPSSPGSSHGDISRPGSAVPPPSIAAIPETIDVATAVDTNVESNVDDVPPFMSPPTDVQPSEPNEIAPTNIEETPDAINRTDEENLEGEQTTLLNNEEESFALAPVDASALKGLCTQKVLSILYCLKKVFFFSVSLVKQVLQKQNVNES